MLGSVWAAGYKFDAVKEYLVKRASALLSLSARKLDSHLLSFQLVSQAALAPDIS